MVRISDGAHIDLPPFEPLPAKTDKGRTKIYLSTDIPFSSDQKFLNQKGFGGIRGKGCVDLSWRGHACKGSILVGVIVSIHMEYPMSANQLGPHMTCSSRRQAVRSHSLVCSKNSLLILRIGPILIKELELIFRSNCSFRTCVYS